MTFKEKFEIDYPSVGKGHHGCPHTFGYEKGLVDGFGLNCPRHTDDRVFTCDECWDREMPDTENGQADESIDISQTPAVNCANCEKHEEEIARLNERILEDKEYINKLLEKLKDRNEELDLYRLMFWTIEATLKIELPDVHTWRQTHD